MKIAVCQINPVIADFDYNVSLIRDTVDQAKRTGCALAIFPEMSLLGYPPKDLLEKPSFIEENLRRLEDFASEIENISVVCGYVDKNPLHTGKGLINSAAFIEEGRIKGMGGKRLLPSYDVFDETRYFEPSAGSLTFEMGGKTWGVTICEDIWNVADFIGVPKYGLDPVSELAGKGVDILVNISASPYSGNKGALRLDILKELTLRYRIPAVYCNQVGGNDDLIFDGSSMVVDQNGRLIRLGRQFAPDLIIWDTEKIITKSEIPGLSRRNPY